MKLRRERLCPSINQENCRPVTPLSNCMKRPGLADHNIIPDSQYESRPFETSSTFQYHFILSHPQNILVHKSRGRSSTRIAPAEVSQRSILAPHIFNINIHDLAVTTLLTFADTSYSPHRDQINSLPTVIMKT